MIFVSSPAVFHTFRKTCANISKPIYFYSIRTLSAYNTMAEPQWQVEKSKHMKLTLEEKRNLLKKKDSVTLDNIDTWFKYVANNKSVEDKRYTEDDVTEIKKCTINKPLNSKLAGRVSIFKGDITKLEVDAIVNAANSMLRAGGGVDGAIHKAAGPYLQEECKTLGGCPTGEAKITGGYNLPARYVIHTVGPQDGSAAKLQSCYEKCLAFQKEYNITSIAFPCISTGIYGFPNRLAAHIALKTARQFLESTDSMQRVIFCTFMPIDVEIYETLMQIYFPIREHNFDD